MHRARLLIAAALTALIAAAVLGGTRAERAEAGAEVCTPCVVLIEVDGLEAKDITPETTPFLWALGHSGDGGGNSAMDTGAAPVAIGAGQTPGFLGRNGWAWAAARGVMASTSGASASALLTGGYSEQSNVVSDEYVDEGKHLLLGDNDNPVKPDTETLTSLVSDTPNKAKAWLGDPRLARITGLDAADVWVPATQDSVPAYCPAPQDADEAKRYEEQAAANAVSCPTADLNVINKASTDLANPSTNGKTTLAYIHLAELGAIKRLHGDVDASVDPAGTVAGTAGVGSSDAKAVSDQLAQTDAAIGAFVNKYANDAGAKWSNTVLFVVGNHGYELTPQTHRVPDPESTDDPGMGLADVIARIGKQHGTTATFIPQGTIGTIYVPAGLNHDATVAAVADELKPGGDVDKDPRCHPDAGTPADDQLETGCIQELLATGYVDADGHSRLPDVGGYKLQSVVDTHPGWHLHHVDAKTGKPSGADGDLMVVLAPTWAAGSFVPLKDAGGLPDPNSLGTSGNVTNGYLGSAGGPRNRAIAAIVNGPRELVKQYQVGTVAPGAAPTDLEYPVSATAVADAHCPAQPAAATGNPNLDVGDDANAKGHECQAETVDFAPTIAALLKIGVPDSQLGGRFLREAFVNDLSPVREEEQLANIPPDDPPPPPEPDVRVPDPPPPPKGYTYSGLMKHLKVTVVDKDGCTWDTARPGAALDYLQITAELGKALSSTTLTFYQRNTQPAQPQHTTPAAKRGKAARHRAHVSAASTAAKKSCLKPKAAAAAAKKADTSRPPLNAIAKFKPFALKRGPVQLKLKIPTLYKPTHIGVFVQEARRLSVPQVQPDGKPGPSFEAFGPAAGAIVAIQDAPHLHAVKPKPNPQPKPRRK